jgi:plastocyanin
MKKQLFSLLLSAIVTSGFCTTHTVVNSGSTFSPATITIAVGDSVKFNIANNHNVVEVSEATWNANGNTPLPGFSLTFGGGVLPPSVLTLGTHYYVCEPHASMGMKGIIIVQNSVGINENTMNPDIAIYPNPSDGLISIEIKNSPVQQTYNLNIFDISGAQILNTTLSNQLNNNIDLTDFPKGLYFVKINNGSALYTRKIIIK